MFEEKNLDEKKYPFREGIRSLGWMLRCFVPDDYEEIPESIQMIRVADSDVVIATCIVARVDNELVPKYGKWWYNTDALINAYPRSYYGHTHALDGPCGGWDNSADIFTADEAASFLIRGEEIVNRLNKGCTKAEDLYRFYAWRLLPTHLRDGEIARIAEKAKEDIEYEGLEEDDEIREYLLGYEIDNSKEINDRRQFASRGKYIWCRLLDVESLHKVMEFLNNL